MNSDCEASSKLLKNAIPSGLFPKRLPGTHGTYGECATGAAYFRLHVLRWRRRCLFIIFVAIFNEEVQ